MKLYNADLSNFATRCRIAIYHKQADIEIAPVPGGGLKSPEYLAVYAVGMVPSLEVDGVVFGEAQAVCEFIEDHFPENALRPDNPLDCARMRWFCALHDAHLEGPFRATYSHLKPEGRDKKLVIEKLETVAAKLDLIEAAMRGNDFLTGQFSLADCALAPTALFLDNFLPLLEAEAWTTGRPHLAAWWENVQTQPAVSRALGEQRQALKSTFGI